ncbi:LuxR C-terminal-related transcriptional regulator [Ewingella sp. S1.OA.A_B6]
MNILSNDIFFTLAMKRLVHDINNDAIILDCGSEIGYFFIINKKLLSDLGDLEPVNALFSCKGNMTLRKSPLPLLHRNLFESKSLGTESSILTCFEQCVIACIINGMSQEDTAAECNFSKKSVSRLKRNAMKKLGFESNSKFYLMLSFWCQVFPQLLEYGIKENSTAFIVRDKFYASLFS